jgi:Holliday junction resolvase
MSQRHHPNHREHRRVLSLAREYRRHGYDVTIYPGAEELPSALATCPFDLIAKGDSTVIAVEVRTRENLTLNGAEDLRRMTEQVKQLPGWDFELVVTNPRPKKAH